MQRLEKLLKKGANQGLDKIVHRAQQMDRLTRAVEAALPAELKDQLVAANLRDDGEVVIICRSSAAAARLRFEQQAILDAVSKAGEKPASFRVSVGRGGQA